MKRKFFTLIVCALLQTPLMASDLLFRMYDNAMFTIIFNNSQFAYGTRSFQSNYLGAGNYSVEIYNACFSSGEPCPTPIYKGNVNIPHGVRILASLDPYYRLNVANIVPMLTSAGIIDPRRVGRSYPVGIYNLNDSAAFAKVKEMLPGVPDPKYKVAFVKHCIYYHGITTDKLAELMLMFSFDHERLDLARTSFWFTYDREVYYKVYDSLIFTSSRQELENYLFSLTLGR